jgi:ribonuclease G
LQNEIIIDADPSSKSIRVALLEEGDLVELLLEDAQNQNLVGGIYRGKVASVLPGMQAAFIDIGLEKNAFLYAGDVVHNIPHIENPNITDLLKPGQELTVQIVKEPMGTKGCRVTTKITLPGRNLVLLPNENYIGISRRIEKESERNSLKKLAEKHKPEGMGLIVRTAAEGKSEEDFKDDIDFLIKLWKGIVEKEKKGNVPRCLYNDTDLIIRTVRDLFTDDTQKLIVNDKQSYEKILELVEMISPSLIKRVHFYNKEYCIFEYYQIESKISRAISRKVWLKSGGYILIDKTEALTVIDVNTGKFTGKKNLEDTVLKTNIEAAGEIAKQLRLRDIGGIIIIDFIDMCEAEHKQMVIDELKQELKKDRTKTTIVGMTGLGLIEMTRKKIRKELTTVMTESCPHCNGTGKLPIGV